MSKLDGKKIVNAYPFYEHMAVIDDQGNKYFMKYEDLKTVLSEFLFDIEVKRKRSHIHPITPDVDLLYEQDMYPK